MYTSKTDTETNHEAKTLVTHTHASPNKYTPPIHDCVLPTHITDIHGREKVL